MENLKTIILSNQTGSVTIQGTNGTVYDLLGMELGLDIEVRQNHLVQLYFDGPIPGVVPEKIKAIKLVREISLLGLIEAKNFVESSNSRQPLGKPMTQEIAAHHVRALCEAGFKAFYL